jgi:hypothetical protein
MGIDRYYSRGSSLDEANTVSNVQSIDISSQADVSLLGTVGTM